MQLLWHVYPETKYIGSCHYIYDYDVFLPKWDPPGVPEEDRQIITDNILGIST